MVHHFKLVFITIVVVFCREGLCTIREEFAIGMIFQQYDRTGVSEVLPEEAIIDHQLVITIEA